MEHCREPELITVDGIKGLPPKPAKPEPAQVGSPSCDLGAGIPRTPFADDGVITSWLYGCPVDEGAGERTAAALAAGEPPQGLEPVPSDLVVADSWPDVTDAIDLNALGGGRPGVRSVFVAAVSFEEPRLVRVCHGAAGMGTHARMWLSGGEVDHGEIVQVDAGTQTVVLEVYHGEDGSWLRWGIARLSARFTEVTRDEIEAVHAWKLAQWQATLDGAKADERALLEQVEITPDTVVGTEGYFRVGRSVNGKWWFIDPDGKPFCHRGCTGLNSGGIGGRRAGLPGIAEDEAQRWLAHLREWGFNAMGAWTTPEFFQRGMAVTDTIEGFYVEPWLDTKFPDVFDPQWADNLDAKCRDICAPNRLSRDILGYFLDNERSFMEVPGANEQIIPGAPTYRFAGPVPEERLALAAEPRLNIKGIGLLQFCLSGDEAHPGCSRAWEFVLEKYDCLKDLGQAWGIAVASRASIRELTAREEILISEAYQSDSREFVKMWTEQYYRVFTAKVRKYDPNHLILGMRHGGRPGSATLDVEAKWTDVISQNNYRASYYESFDETYVQCERPILNGEFGSWTDSFSLVRNPIEPPGGLTTRTRRELRARQAIDRGYMHPGIVGFTKYRWFGDGDDKIWTSTGPQMRVVAPLWQANYRAASIAVASDRPRDGDRVAPLHGQYFFVLLDGSVTAQELPAASETDEASRLIRSGPVSIGLVCREGNWDTTVYGDGIRGEVTRQVEGDGAIELVLHLKVVEGLFRQTAAEAEYTIRLERQGGHLVGTHAGRYEGRDTNGRVIGHCHRPVPTIRV